MKGKYQALNRIQYWHFRWKSRHFYLQQKRKFPEGFEPYGGSQWWCLSRDCIKYINNFIQNNSEFVDYYKYVFIPDESFFQSVVSNSPFKYNIANDDLRFVDWENSNPTPPAVLDTNYLEILQNSSKLLARKFDIKRSSEILDLIDKEILEFPIEVR
ncbi:MAG: hypothetical protein HC820_07835 [Hydrococcus sp. RM1_1_31]|nr:hypothetical protein [Hydrococcus sp. RM1_1_31]